MQCYFRLFGEISGLAVILFARKTGKPIFAVGDFVAPLVPLGIFFGRLGNFINGELWGRPTDVSWGMIFPQVDSLVRHPSQLYQMAGEGIGLFILMWWFSQKPRPHMAVSGLFMVGYGVFRTAVEFFREPDAHLGIRALGFLTQGMILSIPMILVGVLMLAWAYRRGQMNMLPPAVSSPAKKKRTGKPGKGKRT
jgi:phosphatidylglycerol:prolipoprotein diacylglycerol transferase